VGTRTWGGEILLTGSNTLPDCGSATAAEYGVYADGKWLIEGHGVDPDMVVFEPAGGRLETTSLCGVQTSGSGGTHRLEIAPRVCRNKHPPVRNRDESDERDCEENPSGISMNRRHICPFDDRPHGHQAYDSKEIRYLHGDEATAIRTQHPGRR
jgi:hypothetical protein